MAGLFGRIGPAIGETLGEQLGRSPIVQIIEALRQRRKASAAPKQAGSPTSQGVFAPGVFGSPDTLHAPGLGNNAYGGEAGPFGSVY